MNAIPVMLFDVLLNSLLQISLFAIVALAFSCFVARARAKYQHIFYFVVLLFCLTVPVVNTLWHSPSRFPKENQQQYCSRVKADAGQLLWGWPINVKQHQPFVIPPELQIWIGSLWAVLILLQLGRFIRAMYSIHQMRRSGFELPFAQASMARQIGAPKCGVNVLQSTAIDDPVTIGWFNPVILLPTKVVPNLGREEMLAVIAHEYCHIWRRDFASHLVCELVSLPVAWHPGVAYLMSKISQTRELACDEYAATYFRSRHSYANTLLRLASLCLHVPRLSTAGVGFFDSDNLEARITMLTEKTALLSRTGVIGLAFATSITYGAGAVVAHAMSFQTSAERSKTTDKFVGTWHWMFEGRSFVTMVLMRNETRLAGTVTGSRIALDKDGRLSRADPSEDLTPKPIMKITRVGTALHITVKGGDEPFEFMVTLKDATHAQIYPKNAPSNMKPISAEKVR
jgi:beta-lactamase regulating signal transducer with metallopeptidase domain